VSEAPLALLRRTVNREVSMTTESFSCIAFWRLLLAAVCACIAAPAYAAPVTMYFTYETLLVEQVDGQDTTPRMYSGWIRWDLANTESSGETSEPGTLRRFAESESGCRRSVNGVCRPESDYGAGTPVVTDYSVETPFGTLRPHPPSASSDASSRANLRGSVNDEFLVARGQLTREITVTSSDAPAYLYTEFFAWRGLSLAPKALTGQLFTDFDNLDAPVSLAMVSPTQANVHIEDRSDYGECTSPFPPCAPPLGPNWYRITGSLRYLGSAPPEPSVFGFTASSVTVSESAGRALLTVARSGSTAGIAHVTYSLNSGTAMKGSDFRDFVDDVERSHTLYWADGESNTKTIEIPIVNDQIREPTESFTVTLSEPSLGSRIEGSEATVTITDDDGTSGGGGGGGGGSLNGLALLMLSLLARPRGIGRRGQRDRCVRY
jgi:hypothetical protein